MAITPIAGLATQVVTGGDAVTVVPANPNGGTITNPASEIDQGLTSPEALYVCPTGANAALEANDITFALQPGQSWTIIPGQTTTTTVNSASNGHKFSAIFY